MTPGSNIAKKTLLLVDDQAGEWFDLLNIELADWGFQVVAETEPGRAVARIREDRPDVVLLDIMFPSGNGSLENLGKTVLVKIKKHFPSMPVVMFTTTLADAAQSIDQRDYAGASYLFAKEMLGQQTAEFNPYMELAYQLERAMAEVAENTPLDERLGFIVGATTSMQKVADAILRVAPTESTVIVTGESGTGKELVARAIHKCGPRREGPYVAVNCGGLTEETLESRLFGHKKGAFTGANRETKGFFGEAEGGTLFLDEVEAMPPRLQELLLRVLQEKTLAKMGSSREQAVDVRIIAASNQDLEQAVARGSFRLDLLQRLNVFEIVLPPLRQRKGDLAALFRHIVDKKNRELRMRVLPTLRDDVRALLESYDWPGNIRELENTIHSAMVNSRANILTPALFDLPDEAAVPNAGIAGSERIVDEILAGHGGWETLRDIQGAMRAQVLRELLIKMKERNGKRPSGAELAELLGMSSANLRRVLSEAGISLREI